MKIYINNPNEGWVVDRFRKEFYQNNPVITTEDIRESDVIWIIAPWTWASIPVQYLQSKKVVCSIHHIVPNKFGDSKRQEFRYRDQFVDAYHVPCESTRWMISEVLQGITNKPIFVQPFWVNETLWRPMNNKQELREKYKISKDANLIGSFQRDTEGHDLKSPKLEKGPDIFCDVVTKIHKKNKNTEVLLAGWRRQYVMNRLDEVNIKYHYLELPSFEVINELYNCLDMYVVGSRYEGGPQAIFECALTKTPIISTNVGAASLILSEKSIFIPDARNIGTPDVDYAYKQVQNYTVKKGISSIVEIFQGV